MYTIFKTVHGNIESSIICHQPLTAYNTLLEYAAEIGIADATIQTLKERYYNQPHSSLVDEINGEVSGSGKFIEVIEETPIDAPALKHDTEISFSGPYKAHEKYNSFSISPIKQELEQDEVSTQCIVVETDEEAEFFGVYLNCLEGHKEWIADLPTRVKAEEFVGLLEGLLRDYSNPHTVQVGCSPKAASILAEKANGWEMVKRLQPKDIEIDIIEKTFNTEAEAIAYGKGIADTSGWLSAEYKIVAANPDEAPRTNLKYLHAYLASASKKIIKQIVPEREEYKMKTPVIIRHDIYNCEVVSITRKGDIISILSEITKEDELLWGDTLTQRLFQAFLTDLSNEDIINIAEALKP